MNSAMEWRQHFLGAMEELTPWGEIELAIEPVFVEDCPYPLSLMIRVVAMRHWFGYSTTEIAEGLKTRQVMRRFAGLHHASPTPDRNAISGFLDLLDQHELTDVVISMLPSDGRN